MNAPLLFQRVNKIGIAPIIFVNINKIVFRKCGGMQCCVVVYVR